MSDFIAGGSRRDGAVLSERQQEVAVALAPLWMTEDKDEMLAAYWDKLQCPAAKRRLAEWADGPDVDRGLREARELLLPGLLAVEEKFTQFERQWRQVFACMNGTVPLERFGEAALPGLAQYKPPGTPTVLDGEAGEIRFVYQMSPVPIGLGVRFYRSNIDDGSYLSQIGPLAMGVAESFLQTEEILHAHVFNTGHVYNPSIGGDGNALFSEGHPYRNGSYSNATNLELNEENLAVVSGKIRELPDFAGLQLRARPVKLVVPIALQYRAHRLMLELAKTENGRSLFPSSYCVMDYLTDVHAWFVTTSIAGLASVSWKPFKLDFSVMGDDLILEGSQSYGAAYYNPRTCFASYPSPPETSEATTQFVNQMRRIEALSINRFRAEHEGST